MILLCDTNIFLQTTMSSHLTLIRYFRETPRFFLGLDQPGVIHREYNEFSVGSQHLREINKRIKLEGLWRTTGLPSVLPTEEDQKLRGMFKDIDKGFQKEMAWIRTALANPGAILVYPDKRCSTFPIQRRFLNEDGIRDLQNKFPQLPVRSCNEIIEELRTIPTGAPRDLPTLEVFLKGPFVQQQEHDWIEFKCPREGLAERMCRDIAKAVCALLNTTTGYVMIGVDEYDGARVKGYEKKYNGLPRRTDELEITLVNGYLCNIEPKPDLFFRLWSFDLPDLARIVTIIFVEQGQRIEYRYRFEGRWRAFKRLGTQSA